MPGADGVYSAAGALRCSGCGRPPAPRGHGCHWYEAGHVLACATYLDFPGLRTNVYIVQRYPAAASLPHVAVQITCSFGLYICNAGALDLQLQYRSPHHKTRSCRPLQASASCIHSVSYHDGRTCMAGSQPFHAVQGALGSRGTCVPSAACGSRSQRTT